MKTVIFYYSGKGSNKYLAGKAAKLLDCEAIELVPRASGLVLLATATKISFGNKPLKQDIGSFDRVIVCGPLYMGSFAAPCNDFIKKFNNHIKTLDVITCCGSTDAKKDDTFGYGKIFTKLKERLGSKAGEFEAFPIELLLPNDKKDDDEAMMNTRMNDGTCNDTVNKRLEAFVQRIKTV